jgi:hypothetical protein
MNALARSLVALAVLAAVGSGPAAQTPFRVSTDVVVIDASVTDGRRLPITNLKKEDFELRDNGVLQQVLDFDRAPMPLDVTVTIDVSGSLRREDREVISRAVGQVSDRLGADDRARVLTFATLTAERTPLARPPIAVDLSAVGPGTAVFDALLLSVITPPVVDRRQCVLFMTDGEDTTSSFDASLVIETARHASAPTTIVLVASDAPATVRGLLYSVSAQTGGELFELKGHEQLSQTFLTAFENFRTSYVLRYTPTGVSRTGWHDVAVTVKNKSHRVRARRGYWATPTTRR